MQLSHRLQALADLVGEGCVLADIGCDHGYIPIYLVEQKKIPGAIAMDIGKGPLERAEEHIRAHGLLAYIETRLSDGLEKLEEGEADTVLLSGMGGPLMEQILSAKPQVVRGLKELICQPQSHIGHFRFFLQQQGFSICGEEMVEEDGKFYPMMKVFPSRSLSDHTCPLTEVQLTYGPVLLEKRHPVLYRYLLREVGQLDGIMENLRRQDTETAVLRLAQLEKQRKTAQEALRFYELQNNH